jgi:hypothetical protein
MSVLFKYFLSLLFVFSTASAMANPGLPEQFSIKYQLTKGPITLAEMTRKLYSNGNGGYIYESFSEPVGYARWFTKSTLLEKSEWIYHENKLRPLNYSYDRSGGKRKRHVKLKFDWDKLRVTNTINNDPWTMAITDSTLDKLLYHLAVMHDLQLGHDNLEYKVADGGSLKDYKFQVLGKETIKTKLGKIETLKILRPGKRKTILWCAPELNYIPVRIEQNEKEGHLRMQVIELSGITRKPTPTNLGTNKKSELP